MRSKVIAQKAFFMLCYSMKMAHFTPLYGHVIAISRNSHGNSPIISMQKCLLRRNWYSKKYILRKHMVDIFYIYFLLGVCERYLVPQNNPDPISLFFDTTPLGSQYTPY